MTVAGGGAALASLPSLSFATDGVGPEIVHVTRTGKGRIYENRACRNEPECDRTHRVQ
jgi:hypothetical protein